MNFKMIRFQGMWTGTKHRQAKRAIAALKKTSLSDFKYLL